MADRHRRTSPLDVLSPPHWVKGLRISLIHLLVSAARNPLHACTQPYIPEPSAGRKKDKDHAEQQQGGYHRRCYHQHYQNLLRQVQAKFPHPGYAYWGSRGYFNFPEYVSGPPIRFPNSLPLLAALMRRQDSGADPPFCLSGLIVDSGILKMNCQFCQMPILAYRCKLRVEPLRG
ncbi:MAG TPA: hypothetical protein VMI32_12440 [Candidatus Solibacter sp.]|nr:hypothetical protein [Candidatus Solibacter sp.]